MKNRSGEEHLKDKIQCPVCQTELLPQKKEKGRVVYYCSCRGITRPVIEILEEIQSEGVKDGCTE